MTDSDYDLDDLEVFDRRSIPYLKRPQASIQAGGAMSLNAAAHKAIGGPEMVELLYSKRQKIIAIRPCEPGLVHAYPLRPQGPKARTYMITARAFMLHNEIPCETPVRYDLKIIDGMGIIDLNERGYDATSNASRARSKAKADAIVDRFTKDPDLSQNGSEAGSTVPAEQEPQTG